MADFSKQYNEIEGMFPEGMHDFDFDEEFNQLQNNQGISIICEGFGSTAIGKTETGERVILVPSISDDWINYDTFISGYKEKLNNRR